MYLHILRIDMNMIQANVFVMTVTLGGLRNRLSNKKGVICIME